MEMPGIAFVSGIDLRTMAKASVESELAARTQANKRHEERLEAERTQFLSVYEAVQSLSGATRQLIKEAENQRRGNSLTVSSSHPEYVSARPNHQTTVGIWRITVNQLASSHSLISGNIPDSSMATRGSLTIASNGNSWTVNLFPGRTLLSLAKAIQLNTGGEIQASVLNSNEGQRLMLSASNEGSYWRINVSGAGSGETLARSLQELSPSADAELTVNGLSLSLNGNLAQNVISGLELDLHRADSEQQVIITSVANHRPLIEAVKTFVKDVNQLRLACDPRGDDGIALQTGSSTLKSLGAQLRRTLSDHTFGVSLTTLGISTNRQGLLVLDEAQLQNQLMVNPQSITTVILAKDSPIQTTRNLLLAATEHRGAVGQKATYLNKQLRTLARNQQQVDTRRQTLMKHHMQSFSKMDSTVAHNRQLRSSLSSLSTLPDTSEKQR